MSISERTAWKPGKISLHLYSEAKIYMRKQLKKEGVLTIAALAELDCKVRNWVETSAAEANRAILNMMTTVIKDDNHE